MTSSEATLTIQALPPAIPGTNTKPGPQLGPGSIQLSRRCCWKGLRIAVACATGEWEASQKNAYTLLQLSATPESTGAFPVDFSKVLCAREATRLFSDSLSHNTILQNAGHHAPCGIRHCNAPHPACAAHALPVCLRRVKATATPGTKLRCRPPYEGP